MSIASTGRGTTITTSVRRCPSREKATQKRGRRSLFPSACHCIPPFAVFPEGRIMKHLQAAGFPGDVEGFGVLTYVKAVLLSAVGPLAIALFFVIVWSTCVPVMHWTDTGNSLKNVDLETRFWFTLDLLLFELPFAVS